MNKASNSQQINFLDIFPIKSRFSFLNWKLLIYVSCFYLLMVLICLGSFSWLEGGLSVRNVKIFKGDKPITGYALGEKNGFYKRLKFLTKHNWYPSWLYSINISQVDKVIGLYGYSLEKESVKNSLFLSGDFKDFWNNKGKIFFSSVVNLTTFKSIKELVSRKSKLSRERTTLDRQIDREEKKQQRLQKQQASKTKKRQSLSKQAVAKKGLRDLQHKITMLNGEINVLDDLIGKEKELKNELSKNKKRIITKEDVNKIILELKSQSPCCSFSIEER